MRRGLDLPLTRQVAGQLMARDALGAHARDELGLTETLQARPVQAVIASAAAFAAGVQMHFWLEVRGGAHRSHRC